MRAIGRGTDAAAGQPARTRRVRLRWDRIIMVAAIFLALVAGVLYLVLHMAHGSADALPEKPLQEGVLPDKRPACGTAGHPCPNRTCPPGENCLL